MSDREDEDLPEDLDEDNFNAEEEEYFNENNENNEDIPKPDDDTISQVSDRKKQDEVEVPEMEIELEEEEEEEEEEEVKQTTADEPNKDGSSAFFDNLGRSMHLESSEVKKAIRIPDSERQTSSSLSQYELARALSIRAAQYDKSGRGFVDTKDCHTAIDVAKKEITQRMSPLIVIRIRTALGDYPIYYEEWKINEMVIGAFSG